jgi:maleate isomerase
LSDVQQLIVGNYRRSGLACTTERHLGLSVNFEFSEVTAAQIERMAARQPPQARRNVLPPFCTDLRAAALVPALEESLGRPVYYTVATAVWTSLRIAGVDPRRVEVG